MGSSRSAPIVEVGVPTWTTGHFQRISAQDDLGIESVGAGLLRRLLPGILQTTPNAGYYSFYPYLLWRWQQDGGSVDRAEFKRLYRRQECAFALACLLHEHRGELGGINGLVGASQALREQGDDIRVSELAETYMDSAYGGYGLFYSRVLSDIRLTQLGARRYVDRVTDIGAAVASAFAETFEDTRYFKEYFNADVVPRAALAELGETACLCNLPGRSDHGPLLDVFLGDEIDDPAWELRRQSRVMSLALFLEFHRQRPDDIEGSLTSFRRVLASRSFSEGVHLTTRFPVHQNSWRLYQLRECQTLCLTTIWSAYLRRLEELGPVERTDLEAELVANAELAALGIATGMSVRDGLELAANSFGAGGELIDLGRSAVAVCADEPHLAIGRAFVALLGLAEAARTSDEGFAELVDEGGPGRWSVAYMREWFDNRSEIGAYEALADLLAELFHQHTRVAVEKVSETDHRDPFCVAEDDGLLRLIRSDEPFWTGARFGVVNHLLWTLGLIEAPSGDSRLTTLGESELARVNASA